MFSPVPFFFQFDVVEWDHDEWKVPLIEIIINRKV